MTLNDFLEILSFFKPSLKFEPILLNNFLTEIVNYAF